MDCKQSIDGWLDLTAIHNPSHGFHAGVPDAWLQSLRSEVFAILRFADRSSDISQLWHRGQWACLCSGHDSRWDPGRKDVCSLGTRTPNPTGHGLANIGSARFDTNDALYDLAWSEINENQMVVACGDGSLKLFDLGVNDFPVMNFHEHKREAFSVCWNPITKDTFISSSWDGTVKIVSHRRTAHVPLQWDTY